LACNSIESDQMIGYVRASQAPEDLDKIIRALNLGLSGGIVMALVLLAYSADRQAMQPVEQGFQRLKQFTDASHELRGPLMAIKSNVAVALKYPGMRLPMQKSSKRLPAATQMTQLTEVLVPGS